MTFKHGQKVKCTINGSEITDAKISIDKDGWPFICQNEIDGVAAQDMLGYKYSWMLDKDFTHSEVSNLRPAEKTWDTLEIGDEVKDEDGDSRSVLGVCGRVIFLSQCGDKDEYWLGFTKKQLIEAGYTIVQETPEEEAVEMTHAQIEKIVGKKVKIIK